MGRKGIFRVRHYFTVIGMARRILTLMHCTLLLLPLVQCPPMLHQHGYRAHDPPLLHCQQLSVQPRALFSCCVTVHVQKDLSIALRVQNHLRSAFSFSYACSSLT